MLKSLLKSLMPDALLSFLKGFSPRHQLIAALSPLLGKVTCIDVGASYFPHSKWFLFLSSDKTDWFAVDPMASNLSYVADWPYLSTLHPVEAGLSETGGQQPFYVTNVDTGSSLLEPVIPPAMQHRTTDVLKNYLFPYKEIEIDTRTLTEVIDKGVKDSPVFIKLDTQGTELSILRGASAYLAAQRIVGIEMESTLLAQPIMQGSGKFWEACKFLEGHGFELIEFNPLSAGSSLGIRNPKGNHFLGECDAVFSLRADIVRDKPMDYRVALVLFYASYSLFEEAILYLEHDSELSDYLSEKTSLADLQKLLYRRA